MNYPAIQINPETYDAEFENKCARIAEKFKQLGAPKPDIYASPAQHFRMRTEFRVWHESEGNNRCYYAMFDPDKPRQPIEVTAFPIASNAIYRLMQPLMADINNDNQLSRKLFQIEFLSSTLDQVVVTMVYHRQLDEQWTISARKLEVQYGISVIGRARKQKTVLSVDYVEEAFIVQNIEYRYEQKENSFTQPNAAINTDMLNWCCEYLRRSKKKRSALLEMYCGNGNFTIPFAQHFDKVLATEISKTSIASARKNALANKVSNIEFVRLSGEETASALDGEREFRRLKDIELDSYAFSTVFVDPPRAGLDEKTLAFIRRFDEIIYISCNPETLADNIQTLSNEYLVSQFAIFDQFPYTQHCECGVVLERQQ